MAVISPNSFDPVRRYVSVRLAQGVPLVDADWNESEDIRRFELRAFVRWFVGDGVPFGNDGFRIEGVSPAGDPGDFRIKGGGDAAPLSAGRMFVDGLEAFILGDINYTAQPLHVSQAGAAALAARWNVPVIPAIAAAGTSLLVYLDIWERLVTPTEDATLILAGLGTESCSRLKREWAVRVRVDSDDLEVPTSGDPDFVIGHSYVALAAVNREDSNEIISDFITDARRTGLQVQSRRDFEQVVLDTFGLDYATDGTGTPQLSVSIRAVLNGMLHDRPSITAPVTLLTGQPFNIPIGVQTGAVMQLFWLRTSGSDRFFASGRIEADGTASVRPDLFQFSGVLSVTSIAYVELQTGVRRVFYTGQAGGSSLFSRLRGADNVWQPPEIVGASTSDNGVSAVRLSDGSAQVAWTGLTLGTPGAPAIFTRNFPSTGSAPGPVTMIGTTADIQARVVILPGPQAVIFEQSGATLSILTKVFNGAWPAAWTTIATLPASPVRDFAAGFIAPGRLWLCYTLATPGDVRLYGRTYEFGTLGEQRLVAPAGGTPRFPNVIAINQNPGILYQDGNTLRRVSFVTRI